MKTLNKDFMGDLNFFPIISKKQNMNEAINFLGKWS